jgi:hypothetical protein
MPKRLVEVIGVAVEAMRAERFFAKGISRVSYSDLLVFTLSRMSEADRAPPRQGVETAGDGRRLTRETAVWRQEQSRNGRPPERSGVIESQNGTVPFAGSGNRCGTVIPHRYLCDWRKSCDRSY